MLDQTEPMMMLFQASLEFAGAIVPGGAGFMFLFYDIPQLFELY